jgi:hypothetical protein
METKPFYLTSEFWGTVGLVAASVAGLIPGGHQITAAVIAVSTAAYALSRGLAKSGSSPVVGVPVDEGDAGKP